MSSRIHLVFALRNLYRLTRHFLNNSWPRIFFWFYSNQRHCALQDHLWRISKTTLVDSSFYTWRNFLCFQLLHDSENSIIRLRGFQSILMWLPYLFNRVKMRTCLHLNFLGRPRSIRIVLTSLSWNHNIFWSLLSSHWPRIIRGIRSCSSIVFEYSLSFFLLPICLIQQNLIIFYFLEVVYGWRWLSINIFLRCLRGFIRIVLRLYLCIRLTRSLLSRFTHRWIRFELILLLFGHRSY